MTARLAVVADPNDDRGRSLTVAAMALLVPVPLIIAHDESGTQRTFLFIDAALALALLVSALLGTARRRRDEGSDCDVLRGLACP